MGVRKLLLATAAALAVPVAAALAAPHETARALLRRVPRRPA